MFERLRPHPHRGDTIAAGGVPLSLFALLVALRMTQWGVGARFAVVAVVACLILTMGWLAPLEFEGPRSYHSMLLVAGLLPLAAALVLLAEVLGATRGRPGPGALAWTFGLEAVVAAACARRANSGVCTLIAALAAAEAVESFVTFAFKPTGLGTFRAFLLVLTLGFAAGAVRLRDRHRRHAVQLISAGGLLTLVLAATLAVSAVTAAFVSAGSGVFSLWFGGGAGAAALAQFIAGHFGIAAGWKLYVLVVGLALVAYGGADREPGPAYVGVAVLAAFALLDGLHPLNGQTLIAWPLLLLLAGSVLMAVGLRPITPLPPEPPTRPLPPEPPAEAVPPEAVPTEAVPTEAVRDQNAATEPFPTKPIPQQEPPR
jgi:hypothetical protein